MKKPVDDLRDQQTNVHSAPSGLGHVLMFKPCSLNAIDNGAPHAQLPHDLIQRSLANKELFRGIRYTSEKDGHEKQAQG